MKYNVNSNGFYGDFGGAYIPEMLFSNIDELKKNYLRIVEKDSFTSCLLYTSPSPRDKRQSRMPSSA